MSVPVQDALTRKQVVTNWAVSTAYKVGDIVRSVIYTGNYYICTVAGTSNSTAPTWTVTGATVSDSGVTWQYIGAGYPGDIFKTASGLAAYIIGLQPTSPENNEVLTLGLAGCLAVAKTTGDTYADGAGVWINYATGLAVTTAPSYGVYVGTARGYNGSGPTVLTVLNLPAALAASLSVSGNASVGGTLGVTGATTVTTLEATGAVTFDTTTTATGLLTATAGVKTATINAAAGSGSVVLKANNAAALNVNDGSAAVIAVNTNTSSPSVTITPATTVTGALTANGGVTMADTTNIAVGSTNGTIIGTANTQKLGFFGKAAVVQQTLVANTDNAVNNLRDATNSILTVLKNLGLMASA